MNVDKSGWIADTDVDAVTPSSHQELHTLERTVQTVIFLVPRCSCNLSFPLQACLIHHIDNIVVIIIRIAPIFNLNYIYVQAH